MITSRCGRTPDGRRSYTAAMARNGWIAVWPVVAFFLGGLSTQFTGWLTHRRQAAIEARRRREDFEIAHLMELYGPMHELGHAYAELLFKVFSAQYEADRGCYRLIRIPHEDRDDSWREAGRRLESAGEAVLQQIGFILSDEVRDLVAKAHSVTVDGRRKMLRNQPEVPSYNNEFVVAERAISARVREIYAGRKAR
jgi:hypothetical protein